MSKIDDRCTNANARATTSGFTMVEILIVVAIIALIASIAIPTLNSRVTRSKLTRVAADLGTFEKSFLSYHADTGKFPPDSHMPMPYHLANGVGIEHYVPIPAWMTPIPLNGGFYNWEGPDYYPYAGISLWDTRASLESLEELDELIDDGDLRTGKFRKTSNDRYTYIIDEPSAPLR